MARGNKAVLSYSKQDDVSVVPLTGWKILPRVSDSLNNTVELTDSETINDSRLKTAGMVTSANAEGDVEVEMIKGTYDDLIAAAAGNACAGRDNDIGYRKVRRNVRGSIADPVPVLVYPEVPGKRRYAWRNQRVTKAAGAA